MNLQESSRRTFQLRLDIMIRQLRHDIGTGKYIKGTYLPPEKKLGEMFHLSNKSVRRGLEELIGEGLIKKIPRVGSLVITSATSGLNEIQLSDTSDHTMDDSELTLILGCYGNDERSILLSRLLDDFHQLHPHIHVKIITIHSDESITKSLKPVLDHGLIDLFTIKDRHFQELLEHQLLSILEPQPKSYHTYPFLNQGFSFEDELYAQPIIFSPLVLAYNIQHFKEANLMEPDAGWTWSDAIHYAKQLSIPGERYGLHFQTLLEERWPVFLLQSQEGYSADDAKDMKWLEGLRLCKQIICNQDIFPSHLFGANGDVGTLFLQGDTSMIMTSYDSLNRFAASGLSYNISSIPYIHSPSTLILSTGIAVSRFSRNKSEAQLLADFLASARAQESIRFNTLSIPAHKPSAELANPQDDPLNRPSRFHLYRDIIPAFRRYENLDLSTASRIELREVLKRYWTGLLDEDTLRSEITRLSQHGSGKLASSPS